MILMIDNYDSFTYNLVQAFQELGSEVKIFRHDEITIPEVTELSPQKIVISPGPGRPEQAGISLELIQNFSGKIPLLGVCLGHQSIAQCFGGRVVSAINIMHGKVSEIHHNNQGLFSGLPNPFSATRYHSLIVDRDSLPDCFEITAWDGNNHEIMGIQHKEFPLYGVQFHPESIATTHGHQLLRNFCEY
ncbi:MAG: aminodeoxychorismate/anthranilate synthase component II [Proteobacteria bacterium]|nr:aminodeoxychorismate/anthranilate synthase component II [Pseudomonadota bacterium]